MKNKSTAGLQPMNLLLIFGTTIALLVSTSSQMQMISASVEGGAPGPNYYQCFGESCLAGPEQSQGGSQGTAPGSSSGGASSDSNQQAIDHINQAQSALENGDTEGAKMHMDAAKQALGCNKIIDPNC